MNIIKRFGLILMVSSIGILSCIDRSDDFENIYPHQLYTIDGQLAGVVYLATNIPTLRSAIDSTQTTIATLPETTSTLALKTGLSALSGKIDVIWSTLAMVGRDGLANKDVFEGLKNDLTALAARVAADNSILKVQIATIGASDNTLVTKLNELVKANNALGVKISSVQTSLSTLKSFQNYTATQTVVDAMIVQFAAAQFSYDLLLATYMP